MQQNWNRETLSGVWFHRTSTSGEKDVESVDISEEKLQNMQTNVDKLRKDQEKLQGMQRRPDQNTIHEKILILPVYESSRNVCTEVFPL